MLKLKPVWTAPEGLKRLLPPMALHDEEEQAVEAIHCRNGGVS